MRVAQYARGALPRALRAGASAAWRASFEVAADEALPWDVYTTWVVLERGRVRGVCTTTHQRQHAVWACWLSNLCVHPRHRGRGHASALLDAVCGAEPTVALTAEPGLDAFYARRGFTPVAARRGIVWVRARVGPL